MYLQLKKTISIACLISVTLGFSYNANALTPEQWAPLIEKTAKDKLPLVDPCYLTVKNDPIFNLNVSGVPIPLAAGLSFPLMYVCLNVTGATHAAFEYGQNVTTSQESYINSIFGCYFKLDKAYKKHCASKN